MLPGVFWLQVSHRLQAGARPGLQAHGKAQPREAPLPSSFTWPRVPAACWPEASLGFFSPLHRPAHSLAAGFHQNQREGKIEITVLCPLISEVASITLAVFCSLEANRLF